MTYWNHITLGNGKSAVLYPRGSLSRITEADGRVTCNHGDSTPCDRTGHETIVLYEVSEIASDAGSEVGETDRNRPTTTQRNGVDSEPVVDAEVRRSSGWTTPEKLMEMYATDPPP